MSKLSQDAKAYYAGGFRRLVGGVPCKVFHVKKGDTYIRAKDWKPPPHADEAAMQRWLAA